MKHGIAEKKDSAADSQPVEQERHFHLLQQNK